jgi:hypothetical protein
MHMFFSHAARFVSHLITLVAVASLLFKHRAPPHPDAPKPFYKVERG